MNFFHIEFLHKKTSYWKEVRRQKNLAGNKSRVFSVLLLTLLFCMVSQVQAGDVQDDNKRVLFLSSYSYAWDTVQLQIEGIKEGIGSDIELDYEFMDTKRVDDEESRRLFTEGLAYRMSKVEPYDVLIAGDDAALRFAMEHREDLFPDMPVIFEGINDEELANRAAEDPMITGIVERLSFGKNIDLARVFYPDAEKVLAVLDDTITGEALRKSFYASAAQYPNLEFSDICTSKLTADELRRAIASLDENTILLYVVMNEDGSGRHYTNQQAVRFLAEYASVPVFRIVDGSLGNSVLGGNVVSMEISGKLAAQMATEIVNGKDPSEFDLIEDSPNISVIDESVVRKFGLDLSLIPADAQIINHTPSWIERYQELIMPGLLAVCVMVMIIILFGMDSRRKKRITRQLELEQINLIQENSHDSLTGIRNRGKLIEDIERYAQKGILRAAIMLDIDNFKSINDNYGHRTGDDALRQISVRLHALSKEEMIVYRYAGDEFIVLVRTWNTEDIGVCAKRCLDIFEDPFDLGNVHLKISGSLGVAFYERGMDEKTLISRADQAMYQAKRNGKNGYRIYDQVTDDVDGAAQEEAADEGFDETEGEKDS